MSVGAVLCDIYVNGVDDLSIFLLPPVLWTVVLACSTDFSNCFIVGHLPGQPRIYSHKDSRIPSEAGPVMTVNPTPLSSTTPISQSVCSPPFLGLFAAGGSHVVVYIACFSG